MMRHREGDRPIHPPAWALDAAAAGDPADHVLTHLAGCPACDRYVGSLRDEARVFRARADPRAFVAKVRERAGGGRGARRATRVLVFIAPAMAAAAAVALWPSRASVLPADAQAEHFKGGLTIAVVRERAGRQERLTSPFEVEPGDRIRLEVAVDRDRPVAGGLLSSDGSWASLLAPVPLGAGTHYSELAARFDDRPTDAVLIVGDPADVERARATRNFDSVVAWHVTSAPRR